MRSSAPTFAALGLLAALAALAPRAAPALPVQAPGEPPAPAVTWRPERPVQGHLFTIRVQDGAGGGPVDDRASGRRIGGVRGAAGGEELHFERSGGGVWESLAPVPIDASGSLTASIVVRYAGGGEEALRAQIPVAPGDYRHERLTVAPRFGAPLNARDQARLDRDRARAAEVSRRAHLTPRLWTADVAPPRNARVTSGFGDGREFNGQVSSRHLGLDLDGAPGDTVRAAARGVVALADDFLLAGRIVYLDHGGGLLSGYFHLSEWLVTEGDTVEVGRPIGRVGATGRVTGPHLHWVVRYGATSVDPRSLLAVVR